jgi:hypothetical protein
VSYSVDVETLPADPLMGERMTEGLGVTTFAGRGGRCVQLTLAGGFVQLDEKQLLELRKLLKHAQKESLRTAKRRR